MIDQIDDQGLACACRLPDFATAEPACRDFDAGTSGWTAQGEKSNNFGLSTGHASGAIFVERKKDVQRPFSLEKKTRFFFFFKL